jgi:hypothetical protein
VNVCASAPGADKIRSISVKSSMLNAMAGFLSRTLLRGSSP